MSIVFWNRYQELARLPWFAVVTAVRFIFGKPDRRKGRLQRPCHQGGSVVKRNPLAVMAVTIFLFPSLIATPAYAFGLGDLVGMGMEAGGKLVGAAVGAGVDKVKDAMRNPEAEAEKEREEEQKIAAHFQRQIGEIEAKQDLRPLDRERLVIILNQQYAQVKQFQEFAAQAEARQREERDKVFTLGGLAGVAGSTFMNTPTMVMARADAMVKAGVPQAQSRAALAQADALMTSGALQAQARATIAKADAIVASGAPQAESRAVLSEVDAIQKAGVSSQPEQFAAAHPSGAVIDTAVRATTSDDPALPDSAATPSPAAPTMPPNAFSDDLGRKLFVEYIGSPSTTDSIRQQLAAHGHFLATSANDADICYRIEGEYTVRETKQFDGMTKDVGALIESPSQSLPIPGKKMMGSLQLGLAKAFFGLATIQGAAQGKQLPQGMVPQEQTSFRQTLLLVAARQPKDGKETRVSVLKASEGRIDGLSLAQAANADLMDKLGLVVATK